MSIRLVPSVRQHGEIWRARVLRVNGFELEGTETCEHQHKDVEAAKACAQRIADKGRLKL